jgi:hypothetical protein
MEEIHKELAGLEAIEIDSFTRLALQESGNIVGGPNGTPKKFKSNMMVTYMNKNYWE